MIRLIDHQRRISHSGAWQVVPWAPSLFSRFVEMLHVVGASQEGDSVVCWLLPAPFLQAEVNGLCAMVGVDDIGETICRVAGYSTYVPSYRFW